MPKRPRLRSEVDTAQGRPTTESTNSVVGALRPSPMGTDDSNTLPREVLGYTISYLREDYGTGELFQLRLVCRKWRDAVCLVLEDVLTRQLKDGAWSICNGKLTRLIACNLPSMSPTLLRSVSGIEASWDTKARLILLAASPFATSKLFPSPTGDGYPPSGVQTLILNAVRDLTDDGLKSLVKSLTRLRSLTIRNCDRITSRGVVALRNLRFLESLELSGCCATDAIVASVAKIPTLRSLSLASSESELTDKAVRSISRMTELQSVSLRGDFLSDAGLLELSKLPKLTHLNLESGFRRAFEVESSLVAVVKSSPLVSLVLKSFQSMSDSVMFAIAEKAQLSTFSLGGCDLPVATDAINAIVKGCRALTDVNLETPVIDDETLKLLSELLKLRALSLSNVENVIAQGWMHLTKAPCLEKLQLEYCSGLTDDFLEAISALPSLQELALLQCDQVTEAAVEKLRAERLKLNADGTFKLQYKCCEDSDAYELDSDMDPSLLFCDL